MTDQAVEWREKWRVNQRVGRNRRKNESSHPNPFEFAESCMRRTNTNMERRNANLLSGQGPVLQLVKSYLVHFLE